MLLVPLHCSVSSPSRNDSLLFFPAMSTSMWDAGGGGGIRPELRKRSAQPTAPALDELRLALRIARAATRRTTNTTTVTPKTRRTNSLKVPDARNLVTGDEAAGRARR